MDVNFEKEKTANLKYFKFIYFRNHLTLKTIILI